LTDAANPWDPYTLSAEVTIPANIVSGPVPTESHPRIFVEGKDNAGNETERSYYPNVDVQAPSTNLIAVSPSGAANQGPWPIGTWTNKDVTLTLGVGDLGGDGNLFGGIGKNAGVDYTEYVIDTATSTAPTGAGTKCTLDGFGNPIVTVTQSSPVAGPVKVWYRSVDKATPPNVEAWNWVYVYIDKVGPVLSSDYPTYETLATTAKAVTSDYPGWWMNSDFDVHLSAADLNSGILPPGIMWRVGGWHPNWVAAGTDEVVFFYLGTDPDELTDGIYTLDYKASDLAGNESSATVQLKVDTRPPTTDGVTFGPDHWIDGTKPFVLTATDQAIGSGVAATLFRTDNATPFSLNTAAPVATTLSTNVPVFAPAVQGSTHTIDFASVDNARPEWWVAKDLYWEGNWEFNASVTGINTDSYNVTPYKSLSVKLDVTAPAVTAMDPKLGEWQKGPAVVNFSGTDVGSGYAYTEWKTAGSDWTKGEVASVGGNGEITITYHGVDNVGLMSADQTITVKVASTPPTVTAKSASVKSGHKATFKFTVTSVTPTAQVFIQIRSKSGHTLSVHAYDNVATGSQQSKSFMVNLPKGKYNIRIGAVDQAGNVQTRRGTGTLTVK
jgi:hypothetical protein